MKVISFSYRTVLQEPLPKVEGTQV